MNLWMDVAPWCYKWDGWDGIGSPGGVRYRTPYGANKSMTKARQDKKPH